MDLAPRIARDALALIAALILAGACSEGGGEAPASSPPEARAEAEASQPKPEKSAAEDPQAVLVKAGKREYDINCTACHARSPAEDGPVGPAIAGSSLELLQAKVLRNEYPPGYTPKRETQAMIVLPHMEPKLESIQAYLASVADG